MLLSSIVTNSNTWHLLDTVKSSSEYASLTIIPCASEFLESNEKLPWKTDSKWLRETCALCI